jgi:hypothetical protein
LGLQEQNVDSSSQFYGGSCIGDAATSLLAQQLADYSDPSQQGGMAPPPQSMNLDVAQLQRQQSNSSIDGSYVGSQIGQFTPMSLGNSLPYFQSASFGDYGSAPQTQQIPLHYLNALVNTSVMPHVPTNGNQMNPNESEQYPQDRGIHKSSTAG